MSVNSILCGAVLHRTHFTNKDVNNRLDLDQTGTRRNKCIYAHSLSECAFFIVPAERRAMKIGVIGGGRVGCSLAEYFSRLGWLQGITASGREKSAALSQNFGVPCVDNIGLLQQSDVVFLTVPDRMIKNLAVQLAASFADGDLADKIVFHCSGSLGLDCLAGLSNKGAAVGSIHPLQSFAGSKTELQGVYMAVDGDARAKCCAEEIICRLRGKSFYVPEKDRPLYHAAACICSNYLVTVEYLAQQLMGQWLGSKKDAWQALQPLFKGTVDNLENTDDTGSVLTGPIARGDIPTAASHLQVLPSDYLPVYCSLGRETAKLAAQNGTIDSKTLQQLQHLMEAGSKYGR